MSAAVPLRHDNPAAGASSCPPGAGGAELSADLPALLAAAARGDQAAWRSVIDLYARRVYALARSRCGRHDVAEEVTQSVFVTVATKLAPPALTHTSAAQSAPGAEAGAYTEQGRFESWLFRIAMNRIRDEARRQKRQAIPVDPLGLRLVGTPDHDHHYAATEGAGGGAGDDEIAALRVAMSRLSEADREIVELRHHAGLSFRQMTDLLEEPLGTLLARHHRALKKLKDLLARPGDAPPPTPQTAS